MLQRVVFLHKIIQREREVAEGSFGLLGIELGSDVLLDIHVSECRM